MSTRKGASAPSPLLDAATVRFEFKVANKQGHEDPYFEPALSAQEVARIRRRQLERMAASDDPLLAAEGQQALLNLDNIENAMRELARTEQTAATAAQAVETRREQAKRAGVTAKANLQAFNRDQVLLAWLYLDSPAYDRNLSSRVRAVLIREAGLKLSPPAVRGHLQALLAPTKRK